MIVASVLKSGGLYTPEHVGILAEMAQRHLRSFDRFVCLTDRNDLPPTVETIPLAHPGWERKWLHLELFRPIFPDGERILHLGLNTILTGELRDIAGAKPHFITRFGIEPAVMLWTAGEQQDVYKAFVRNPIPSAQTAGSFANWVGLKAQQPAIWEDLQPNAIVSYTTMRYDERARIVCFDGWSKPWDPDVPEWMAKHYQRGAHAAQTA